MGPRRGVRTPWRSRGRRREHPTAGRGGRGSGRGGGRSSASRGGRAGPRAGWSARDRRGAPAAGRGAAPPGAGLRHRRRRGERGSTTCRRGPRPRASRRGGRGRRGRRAGRRASRGSIASTSGPGALSKRRRSAATRPKAPATAIPGSASVASSGVRGSPVGSIESSARTTIAPAARRRPRLRAAAWPRRPLVQTTSGVMPAIGSRSDARAASRASCAPDGALATITTWVPAGACARSPASMRERSSGLVLGDELDREASGGRLVEHRRHVARGAVADDARILDSGRRRRAPAGTPSPRPRPSSRPPRSRRARRRRAASRERRGQPTARAPQRGSQREGRGRAGSPAECTGPDAHRSGGSSRGRRSSAESSRASLGAVDRVSAQGTVPRRVRKTLACPAT